MKDGYGSGRLMLAGAVAWLLPGAARACAVCYGQSDSAMAVGMNWGIFSLLAIILMMLGGVAGFFVFLARRSAALAAASAGSPFGELAVGQGRMGEAVRAAGMDTTRNGLASVGGLRRACRTTGADAGAGPRSAGRF